MSERRAPVSSIEQTGHKTAILLLWEGVLKDLFIWALTNAKNNIGFVAFAAFSARTRDFFAASVKFRVSSVQPPSPPQRVRTSRIPQSPSGAAGNGKGGRESPPTSRAA